MGPDCSSGVCSGRWFSLFVLTNDRVRSSVLRMKLEEATRQIQSSYPRIYLACHSRHERSRNNPDGISRRESQILQHLESDPPYRAGALARHLGVGAPALSASLDRLEAMGLAERRTYAPDRRQTEIHLTPKGRKIMRSASVLETSRVEELLARMTDSEIEIAVRGLQILGRARDGADGGTEWRPNGDNSMTKFALALALLLGLLALVVVASGFLMPKEHSVTRTACLDSAVDEVWDLVADFEGYADWREDVQRIEVVSGGSGASLQGSRFIEYGSEEPILFEVELADRPSRLVSRIADEGLPFGGRWTFELSRTSECTTLVEITEDGHVSNFLYRALSPLFSKTATMDRWLDHLRGRLGESEQASPGR